MKQFTRHCRVAALSALLILNFFCAGNVQATPEPPGLLTDLPGKSRARPPQQAIDARFRAVSLDRSLLRSGRFFVNLADGVSLEVVREAIYEHGNGRSAWVGHAAGNARNKVIVGRSGDAVAATFAVGSRLFKLEPRADGTHVISEISADPPAPELDPIPVGDNPAFPLDTAADDGASADDGSIIDVLVAYTRRIQLIYGTAGADALIIQAVAEANQAYANSGINPRINLVATVMTDYVESGSMVADLNRLRDTSDGHMDELHALRDSYGADLVSLIEHEPQACGYAYLMTSLSADFAASAFSVVHHTCATGYYSFAHELGHNQGAHHDAANASGGLYPYARGYQDPFGNFRSVMAYDCLGSCPRVDYFSNPEVLYQGQVIGISGAADNALTLNNTATTVARFREAASQTSVPAAPSGLNATASSQDTIGLNWTDNASDESGYRLERSTGGGGYTEIASLNANSNSYMDDDLLPDTIYNYRVRAWNSAGNSGYSNVATAATEAALPVTSQLATGDLTTRGTRTGSYRDTWVRDGILETIQERLPNNGANFGYLKQIWTFEVAPGNAPVFLANATTDAPNESFTFYYSTDNRTWVSMFTLDRQSPEELEFTLPSSISGTLYIKVLDQVRIAGEPTSHSIEVDHLAIRLEGEPGTEPPPTEPLPNRPQSPSASAAGTDSINIEWVDASDNENGFSVDRRIDGSSQWQQAGTVTTDVRSYRDTGLQAGVLYHYRVSAFNGSGSSAYTDPFSARTDDLAAAQISLEAIGYLGNGSQHRVNLVWSGASSRVDIYRNGQQVVSSARNNGAYRDKIRATGSASYNYELCEENTSVCSNMASVVF